MLVMCDHNCINRQKPMGDTFVILNISCLLEGFPRVNILPPFEMDRYSRDFDILYAQYLLNNENVFYEFMQIIMSIYYGFDTILLVDRGELYECVNESLIKFIQQRYGLICNNINVLEDWLYVEECEFSLQGLYNLDQDKERFTTIHAKYNEIN